MSGTPSMPGNREATGLGYQSALDGLRAVAVLAVMAYHAAMPWAEGGFLGVDIFFVLSGFLITTLLAREQARSGTLRLGRFYMRRTLRLLPALVTVAAFVHIYVWWTAAPAPVVAVLRRETALTLLYMANWAQVAGLLHPFGFFGHAWSLAIEEQFYILWPLALGTMLRHLSRPAILAILAAAAAASALLRALLWDGPASFSRAFHGSDTRAEALLVGALVALLLAWGYLPSRAVKRATSGPLAAAAALVLAILLTQASSMSDRMFHGGFTVAAVATALLLVDLQRSPDGACARVLSWPPLVAIGRISYGLYLWHWPLFLICRPEALGISPLAATFVRLAATFGAATLSWVLIERPFLRWKQHWS